MTANRRRVTLDAVAAAAGVSRMTASYAYNQPTRVAATTRQRVLAAAEELGFLGPDPSGRFLRQGALRSLGLVLGESLSYVFEDPQATRFVAGLAQVCTSNGYALTIIPTTGGPQDGERIAAAAVDAFVVWTTTADDPVLDAVRATHRRAVIHGGPPVDGFTLVGIDNRAAARALAAEVWATSSAPAVLSFPLDRDRRAGVHVGLDLQRVAYPVTLDRLAGFRDAAGDLGLDWSTVPVAVCSLNHAGHARAAITELLAAGHQFDGLAAMSDQQALGARDAILVTGRTIPADVTLGGFDDSPEAAVADLTSVHQSLLDQGARAATLALRYAGAATGTVDDWQLSRRASTSGR
ncbi:LacI family DNA-binding transcriptional regulator [Jannaschia sp. R86511]|uniref:LacI family DNA-binding transcriptional regulator n=1 Tax=Jannaschia sp. R86511 TaxID=3093853 RepID=UPI0036D2239E